MKERYLRYKSFPFFHEFPLNLLVFPFFNVVPNLTKSGLGRCFCCALSEVYQVKLLIACAIVCLCYQSSIYYFAHAVLHSKDNN